jgi:hypothetical protein
LIERKDFNKFPGRNSRKVNVVEEPMMMAMQICDFQSAYDAQTFQFALVAANTIPGWSRVCFAIRSPAASHYFAGDRIQACRRQQVRPSNEGSRPTSDC